MDSKSQLWDFVKCRIGSETIAYSIQKSGTNRRNNQRDIGKLGITSHGL